MSDLSKFFPTIQGLELEAQNDYVWIQAPAVAAVTSGGIILPDTAIKAREFLDTVGKIVAIGPAVFHPDAPTRVNRFDVGDIVVTPIAGTKERLVKLGSTVVKLRCVKGYDIQAIIKDILPWTYYE